MHPRARSILAALTFAALSAGGIAMATTITSTGWTSPAGGWFATITPGSNIDASFAIPGNLAAVSSVTLYAPMSPSNPFVFTSPDNSANLYEATVNNKNGLQSRSGTLEITPPAAGVNAFYLGFSTLGGTPVTITLSDTEQFTLASTSNTETGLWLSISHPITWLTISSTSFPEVTGLTFGSSNITQDADTTPTPETTTALLVAGGLLLLVAKHRKMLSALPA